MGPIWAKTVLIRLQSLSRIHRQCVTLPTSVSKPPTMRVAVIDRAYVLPVPAKVDATSYG
jgi:hypothetical protein